MWRSEPQIAVAVTLLNAGVRDRVDAHVLLSVPGQGFHSWLLYFGAQHPTAEIVPPPLSLATDSRAYADLRKKPVDDDQAIDDNAHGLDHAREPNVVQLVGVSSRVW
jgi:hypothetical protein